MIDVESATEAMVRVAAGFPEGLRERQEADLPRAAYHAALIADVAPKGRMVDIGAGVGVFPVGCAALGMDVVIVDDFNDPANETFGRAPLQPHLDHGVEVHSRDAVTDGLGLPPASVDVVCSFDSMEHWHASPKALFAEVVETLRPGGSFLLGVPNAANLRKRIDVPLGRGKWSQMADWYERPTFRGHVREPDVDDLWYIAEDMGLVDVKVWGRNWQGLLSPNPKVQRVTRLIDGALRRRPSLCSDLYLLGRKPV